MMQKCVQEPKRKERHIEEIFSSFIQPAYWKDMGKLVKVRLES